MASNPDWHPEDVKAAIRKTGVTVSELSKLWGYHPDSVRAVFRRPWPEVEGLIAKHLRRQPWMIWPSRYDQQRKPIKRPYVRRVVSDSQTSRNRNATVSA